MFRGRAYFFLWLVVFSFSSPQPLHAQAPFSFTSVLEEARELAKRRYEKPATLPKGSAFSALNYEEYLGLQFDRARELWREPGSSFRAAFFPAGFIYDTPVSLFEVRDGKAAPIVGSMDMFKLKGAGDDRPSPVPLAGFRLSFPLHGDEHSEVTAFLGASYFRPIGREQAYGASARGLAIDTASSRSEEFPIFRSFWLVKPDAGARHIEIWALLDSPAVAGAYAFTIRPGTRTVIDVSATIFLRHGVSTLGIAPLTSMFLMGKAGPRRDDFRPEVHDSDGLSMITGAGEHIWRPLANPRALSVSSFGDRNPRGFGLLQRERRFDQYQDLVASYATRPSLWVEPLEEWGEGSVRLIEIPTDSEVHDNIVALWVPARPALAGDERTFRYRLSALADEQRLSPGGRVIATRTAAVPDRPKQRRLLVEFAGGDLDLLRREQPVEARITLTNGKLIGHRLELSPKGSRRLFIDIEPAGKASVDVRAHLALRGEVLTETFLYELKP